MEDHTQLYKEATFVGIALVPMWYAVTKFTLATRVLNNNPQAKAMLDVLIAGILFHLTAEESGLNTWYLTNSYAFQHSFSTQFKRDESCALYNNRGSDGSEFGGLFGLQDTPNW
jgi:hypothetical protein